MKVKGINAFEQHLEKIVFGAALLGAAVILGWHFLSAPEVKVGSQAVPPDQVDRLLESRADQLRSKLRGADGLRNGEGKGIPGESQIEYALTKFDAKYASGVSPVDRLAATSPTFNGMLVRSGGVSSDVLYRVPSFKPMSMLDVQETSDALPPESAKEASAASPAVASRLGPVGSAAEDVVWATPVAMLDLKAIRDELASSDPAASPPVAAVPSVWYQGTPFVLDVVFERRERLDDGSWSAPSKVPVFASRPPDLNFRARLEKAEGQDASLRDDVFGVLGVDENQREVLQPTFFDTVHSAFVSPEVLAAASASGGADRSGEMRARMRLETQLSTARRKAEALEADLAKIGGPWDEEAEKKKEEERKRQERENKKNNPPPGGSGGGGGGRGGLGGGGPGLGGGGGPGRGGNAPADDKDAKRVQGERRTKTQALRKLQDEIRRLESQLGGSPKGAAEAKGPAGIASMDSILAWCHDLEVVPGKTYQYRCFARVYNPFFARKNMLVKAQQDAGIADRASIDCPPSEWSGEVRVAPIVRFFAVRAVSGDGALGLGSAQFEVYRLHEGRRERLELNVQPGERIGRLDDDIDFTTEYYLVDVVEDVLGGGSGRGGAREKRSIAVIAPIGRDGVEYRMPSVDVNEPERRKLKEEAEAASASRGAKADAPAGGAGGPSGG